MSDEEREPGIDPENTYKIDPFPAGIDPEILDLHALDAELMPMERELAKHDLFFLAHDILGYRDIDTPWHRQLCKIVTDTEHLRYRMFLVPRGTFKTTLLTIADSIRLAALYGEWIRIAIMSSKLENAQRMLAEIKWQFLHNVRLRRLFPEMAPPEGEVWGTKSSCVVPNRKANFGEGTFTAVGTEQHVVSNHYFWLKKDDPQDQKNATTSEQLDALDEWDKRTFPLMYPVDEAHNDYIGTRWAVRDLYARAKVRIPSMFVVERSAERGPNNEPDKLLCPSVLSKETLAEIRDNMGSAYYHSQYLMDPIDPETAAFRLEDLELCRTNSTLGPDDSNYAVIVDPGFFKHRGSSKSGIVVLGLDVLGQPWVVDGALGKYSTRELASIAYELGAKWKAVWMIIEQISNEALKDELDRLIEVGDYVPAIQVIRYHQASKEMRILRCQGPVQRHSLRLCNRSPVTKPIIDAFVEYPLGTMDIIDSLAMGLEYAVPKLRQSRSIKLPSHALLIRELQSDDPDPMVIATMGHMDDLPPEQWNWDRVEQFRMDGRLN